MKKKFLVILGLVVIVAVLAVIGGYMLALRVGQSKESTIDSSYITGKLDNVSELATAKLTYTGIISYEDGSIPLLTKKGFNMIYTATVKAGIDFSKVEAEVTDTAVTVRLPKAEVLSIEVDADSIRFYDEKFALFNLNEKKDVTDSIAEAEQNVGENADLSELTKQADSQAQTLIRELLRDSIGDRELTIIVE